MYNLSKNTYIDGIDNTPRIETLVWSYCGSSCMIKFRGTPKVYTYGKRRVTQSNTKSHPGDILAYLQKVADILPDNSVKNRQKLPEKDKSFLRRELDKIEIEGNKSILYDYLARKSCSKNVYNTTKIIYPFGCNKSQLEAIRNALTHNISVIEGPPGTGKTQTILNIIANILKDNKNIAIVSGNNSATSNVAEKLKDNGYGDIVAVLGNNSKQEDYFSKQHNPIELFEDVPSRILLNFKKRKLARNTPKLERLFDLDNKLDVLKREIFQLQFEAETFQKGHTPAYIKDVELLLGKKRWSSKKWMSLRDCCQAWNEQDKYVENSIFKARLSDLKIWFKVLFQHHFRINSPERVSMINDISDYAALRFYETKNKELSSKKDRITNKLKGLGALRKQQQKLSEQIFRSSLNKNICRKPLDLNKGNYKKDKFATFIKQVPVILSTTNSIRQSIAEDFLFDYLVIDEASQVDLITASIALSCTKNVIIVGDEKQLQHIVSNSDEIRVLHEEKDMFNYVDHNILTSIKQLPDIPSVTLLEHYRCNPLIIDFCNQRFYDGRLIIKTDWSSANPFEIYTTDRKQLFYVLKDGQQKKMNYEQHSKSIEVVKAVLKKDDISTEDVCLIAPYRAYVDKSRPDLEGVAVDTVHKFQGREKEVVILATVEDKDIEDGFLNNLNLVNVAVSRAKKELKLICGYNMYTKASLKFNMGALIKYMMRYGGNITFHSIFDNLYDNNLSKSRKAHLKAIYGSNFASENLIHELLRDKILKDRNDIGILCNYPLRYVIEQTDAFTREEKLFISRSSHIDFFLFNKIDKSPALAIEVNGQQHNLEKQANRDRIKKSILEKCKIKLLSLDTLGSNEVEQIQKCIP